MKTAKETILSQLLDEVYEKFPNESYSDWDIAEHVYDSLQPQWIKINSETDLPDKSQTVLVWQYNLSDLKSSRLQKAEYFSGIFKIYPRSQGGYFEEVNDFKAYDLEGDMCQITHWMPLPQPPKED